MVVYRDANRVTGALDLFGHVNVCGRWGGITRWMIVHKDQSRRIEIERAFDHLAWVDRDMINSAYALNFIRDQDVLAIKEQYAKQFGVAVRHGHAAVIQQCVPA